MENEEWVCTTCGTANSAGDVCSNCKNPKACSDLDNLYSKLYPGGSKYYSTDDTIVAIRVACGGSPMRGDGTTWPNPKWSGAVHQFRRDNDEGCCDT